MLPLPYSMLKGFKGLPLGLVKCAPREPDSTCAIRRAQFTWVWGPNASAGGHTSSHPTGLKLSKRALSSIFVREVSPGELRVLVKGTHVASLLLLVRGYDP